MAFGDILSSDSASSTNPGTSLATSTGAAVLWGNLAVVCFGIRSTTATIGATSIVDNLGNEWKLIAQTDGGTTANKSVWYSLIRTSGTMTVTVSWPNSVTSDAAVCVVVYAGPFTTSPLDKQPADLNDAVSPYDCPASGTLSQAAELIIATGCNGNGITYVATSPNVIAKQAGGTGANTESCVIGSWVVAATTTVAPQFTSGTNTNGNFGTATFMQGITPSLGVAATKVYDKPVERVYSAGMRSWVQGFRGQFAAPIDATNMPSVVTDWSTPQAAPRGPDLLTWIGRKASEAAAAPFNQDDWQIPRLLGYAVSLRTLIGTKTLDPPLRPIDWPLPRSPDYAISLRTFIGGKAAEPVVVAAPFSQDDWPLPIVPVYAASLRTWSSGKTAEPIDTTNMPSVVTDWSTPPAPHYAVSLRTLIGSKTAAVVAKPFNQSDWPLPRPSDYPSSLRSWISTTITAVVYVFREPTVDAPYPVVIVPQTPLGSNVALLSTTPVDTTNMPSTVTEWPSPTQQRWPILTWTQNKAPEPTTAPFGQDDWPVPQRLPYAITLRTWTYNKTAEPGAKPFAQTDWPLPSKAFQPTRSLAQAKTAEVVDQPFVNPLPDPRTPSYPNDLRTWLGQSEIVLKVPAAPIAWPLPRTAAYATDLRTWINQVNRIPGTPPQNQDDWPLPRSAVYPNNLRTLAGQIPNPLKGPQSLPPGTAIGRDVPRVPTFMLPSMIGTSQSVLQPQPPPTTGISEWIIRARRRGRR